ncbi:MAG: fused MFS/spermidine synthase [Planctomycetes bacterium]|nr:fused MFS/spermidine synthase [Planctomycetota bacterium]
MSGTFSAAARQSADSILSLLEEPSGDTPPGAHDSPAVRPAAIADLRSLGDDDLLDALQAIYRRGIAKGPGPSRAATASPASAAALPVLRPAVGFWLVTAAIAGAVVMALELVAFRLYAPYFGYSIYVWGSMISVVMLALALGYALGGRLADRSRSDAPLFLLILASALYQLVIIYCAHALLKALSQSGEFLGTSVATLIVFTPSMTALATTGPFIIRLLTRAGREGTTAGKVYAVSTLGSIAGILLTSFVLVPRLGTQATLGTACGVSALLAAVGLMRRRPAGALALLPLLALPFIPRAAWAAGTVWASESEYNLVRVMGTSDNLKLILNDERTVATRINPTGGWTGGYFDDFSLGPLLASARRVLVLGMGAGASIGSTQAGARAAGAAAPIFDAVEIDPKVVEAATRFFGIDAADANVRIHIADARPWLMGNADRFDLVHVDLYQGGPYIPFYLVTEEFFELVRRHMSDDGLLMMNVLDVSQDHELLHATGATLRRVFSSVVVYSRSNGSHMVFAFHRRRPVGDVRGVLASATADGRVGEHARAVAERIVELVPPPGAAVFTDDRATVEEITRRMLASGD